MKHNLLIHKLKSSFFYIVTIFLFSAFHLNAQTKLSLEQCISKAQQDNLLLGQQLLKKNKSVIEYNAARNAFLPEISASIKTSSNWGLLIDQTTNELTRKNNFGTNTNINLLMPLFSGFAIKNNILLKSQSIESENLVYKNLQRDISIQVSQSFFNALLNLEKRNSATENVNSLKLEFKNIKSKYEKGILQKRDLLNVESLLAIAISTETEANSNYQLSIFELKSLINCDDNDSLILDYNTEKEPISMIFPENDTLFFGMKPELENASLQVKMAESSYNIEKANFYPKVNIYGNIGAKTSTKSDYDFGYQLNKNQNQTIGLNFIIPIYNRNQIVNNLKLAELEILNKKNVYQQVKKEINREIKIAQLAQTTAYQKYNQRKKQFEAVNEELRYNKKLYELGSITLTELNEVSNRFNMAKSELIQAKYEFLLQIKIIEIYLGK